VHEADERYTTTAAKSVAGGVGSGDLDAMAAAIILEQHLSSLAAAAGESGAP
jgi:RNase H-fold protein (predicted Holliday junction resolvase)